MLALRISALWLTTATKMVLLSSWQSLASRHMSHKLKQTVPSYVLPTLTRDVTQGSRSPVPFAFKSVRDLYVLGINVQLRGLGLLKPQQRGQQSSEQETRTLAPTYKPFLLEIFNLLQCPFNFNAEGEEEISISSSAYSLYGEMLENLCYL